MTDINKKFHEFALKSILFKGRGDWYFCYLKTERIAHVLMVLSELSSPEHKDTVAEVANASARLPGEIAHLAAGEVDAPVVLSDIFSLLSSLRILATEGGLRKENVSVLVKEYEVVAERLVAGSHPSPFVSSEDFTLPPLSLPEMPLLSERFGHAHTTPQAAPHQKDIKDSHKGHNEETERMSLILDFIRKNKKVSIKDIAAVVRGCSEKTIQRELTALISKGVVRKVGERRWSLYIPA